MQVKHSLDFQINYDQSSLFHSKDSNTTEKNAIQSIKARWREDLSEDSARINAQKTIPDKLMAVLNHRNIGKIEAAVAVMGRCREIMELYRDTHFVFTHGKCYYLSLVDDFIKEYIRIVQPEKCRSHFKHLRLPNASDIRNYQDFCNRFHPEREEYSDNADPTHLIACDWDLENTKPGESAYCFFWYNSSILMGGGDSEIRKLLIGGLVSSIPNTECRSKLVENVCNHISRMVTQNDEADLGSYYLFCIPKTEIDSNFAYLSHPYGKPCEHYKGDLAEVLEGLQTKRIDKVCEGQIRILAGRLQESTGSRIFRFTNQPKWKVKENKLIFRKLIKDALAIG